LLLEAILWLALAAASVAVLPFRTIGRLAACPTRRPKPAQQLRQAKVTNIRWAIVTAARRVPWRAVCIQQGLAAQFMLRRRGIPSVLYYGAAQDFRTGLSTHVWVRDGDFDVVGGEISYRFAILATFPSQNLEIS
jgi:hypothetical protein